MTNERFTVYNEGRPNEVIAFTRPQWRYFMWHFVGPALAAMLLLGLVAGLLLGSS